MAYVAGLQLNKKKIFNDNSFNIIRNHLLEVQFNSLGIFMLFYRKSKIFYHH